MNQTGKIYRITEEEIRQQLVKRHTLEVQRKLDRAFVAVCGLGGLGSNVALALARIGVGHLHLLDFDRVDMSNLNRQQYLLCHVGRYKTDALNEELTAINPYLDIKTDCIKVTAENIKSLFAEDEIICEAFDVPECKALLVNGIIEHFPCKTVVAASGLLGYGNSNAIVTRKITEHFYLCGDGCGTPKKGGGLMAPRVMLAAAHQANMITELIIQTEQQNKEEGTDGTTRER